MKFILFQIGLTTFCHVKQSALKKKIKWFLSYTWKKSEKKQQKSAVTGNGIILKLSGIFYWKPDMTNSRIMWNFQSRIFSNSWETSCLTALWRGRMLIIWAKRSIFLSYIPYLKNNSFWDLVVFELPYVTVERRSWILARSASLCVARIHIHLF